MKQFPSLQHAKPFRTILIFVICVLCFPFAPPPTTLAAGDNSLAPAVALESGALEGIRLSASPNLVAFLGVPYAAPPIGDLRWKPPQPAKKWSGTRKTIDFAPPCSQLPAGWLPYLGGQEDCLYLNVWTTEPSSAAKLPVIVFFHGGSNRVGYSQMNPLGPALSPLGVVFVSANYRLGPFGFLAHPALTAESEHHSSGNYGLLDQLQALQWVHDNISRFGGDPARVTVMGQSSGAVDICLLMASPLAAGLFQAAILHSGECQGTLNEDIRAPLDYNLIRGTGESAGERLVHDLQLSNGPDLSQKLRSLPAAEILKTSAQDPQLSFDAIVDGWLVPEQPAKIFAAGKQLHIPILIGSNANEATVFGPAKAQTVDQYRKYLLQDAGKYADQEFAAFPVVFDADVPARYFQFKSDSFAYGAYSMALSMTRAGQKAFLYYFTFVETGKRAPLGAYHGEELYFLSDSFSKDWEHSAADQKLGKVMRVCWTQFAKTGHPQASGLPTWPAFDPRSDQRFELGRSFGPRAVPTQIHDLEHIMNQVLADAAKSLSLPNSN